MSDCSSAAEGHRRRFGEADKRRILEEAARPGASVSDVARRYGIDRRIVCRWKQELSRPVFVAIKITDVAASVERPVMTTLLPPNVKMHLGLGYIDMRKGIDGLSSLITTAKLNDVEPSPISKTCSSACLTGIP